MAEDAQGFVDLEALLDGEQPDGILDSAVVYDYCHLRPSAHGRVAQAMGEILVQQIWPDGQLSEAPAANPEHFDAWLGEGVEGDRGGYSPNPGRDRKRWWLEARERTENGPTEAQDWMNLARVNWHSFHGQCGPERGPCLPDGIAALDRALALRPGECAALANRGRIAYALGDRAAGSILRRAVGCRPEDLRSRWYLERVLAESVP
jgi:hypothetical protein